MPAFTPFAIALFALQAAVGYVAYRSLRGTGPTAAIVGVCVTLLGTGVLFEVGLIAALVVDVVAAGLATLAGARADAPPVRT
jgi:hypothetical protein